MRRATAALQVLLASACAAPATSPAERWTTFSLAEAARGGTATPGGFPSASFVTLKGAPLPFAEPDQRASADGWSVLPAFARGSPAAYMVSEVWVRHPDPWLQPVYVQVDGFEPMQRTEAADGSLIPNVFGVGEESTFYSPFWEMVLYQATTPTEDVGDVRAVLASAVRTQRGPFPLCPLMPSVEFVLAAAGEPKHPITRVPLTQLTGRVSRIDGARTPYIDFGPNRVVAGDSGVIVPTRVFHFTGSGGAPLALPPVLADDAVRNSYARRVDVALDLTRDAVFVPSGARWDSARAQFQALPVDPGIPMAVAHEYALRVASNPACFASAAAFPQGCQWLDAEAAIDALPPSRLTPSEVTMSVVALLFAGAQP